MQGLWSGPFGVLAAFLLTCGSGVLLTRAGRPYGSLIFNVHKLVALGAVVLTFLAVRNLLRQGTLGTVTVLLGGVAIISVVALFATGGLLSAREDPARILFTIHRLMPAVAAVSATCLVYVLTRMSTQ